LSKCDLSIQLERQDPTYRPGETLRGRLEVGVNDDCACNGLSIELGWQTHGRGNRVKGDPDTQSFEAKQLVAGEKRIYPFEFTLPAGPVTYRGNLVNVDWYLRARADIPWALDPKDEQEILLVPGPDEVEMRPTGGYREPARRVATGYDVGPEQRTGLLGPRGGGAALIAAVFGLGAFGCVSALAFSRGSSLIILAFFVLPVLFALRALIAALRRPMAESRLGQPHVEIDPPELRRGELATIRLALSPSVRVQINGASMELRGREIAVSGSGTNETTHEHDLFRAPGKLEGPTGTVEAGASSAFQGTIALPPDAAPTFRAKDNEVRWSVILHVEIEGWPDWRDEYVFTVVPSA
jgi:hypothetical protein